MRTYPALLRAAACTCLLASADTGAAPFGPRLLLAETDGRAALFLAESHIGSPAQQDAYFRTVIRPAFAASSALLTERSSVPWYDAAWDGAACPDEGAQEASLDSALDAALRRELRAVPPAPVPGMTTVADRVGAMRRFLRFYLVFVNVQQRAQGRMPARDGAAGAGFSVRNAQSGLLLAGAPRPTVSVEDTGTWLGAYCALPPSARALLIAATVRHAGAPAEPAPADASPAAARAATYRVNDAAYRRALADLAATLDAPTAADGAAEPPPEPGNANYARAWTPSDLVMARFTLAERSRAWVAALPAVLARERLPFYALGAAHFADGPYGPGLVTLLRRAGYAVAPLRDVRTLRPILARLPALPDAPPVPDAPLAGGCRRDGASYGCTWRSATTSYTVLNIDAAHPEEIWSACFERAGRFGPERHCVSSTRKRGPDRAADLEHAAAATAPRPPPGPS